MFRGQQACSGIHLTMKNFLLSYVGESSVSQKRKTVKKKTVLQTNVFAIVSLYLSGLLMLVQLVKAKVHK